MKGRSDLLGQTLCQPKVKLAKESYSPPKLVWNKLECEKNRSGEILAAFEILEVGFLDQLLIKLNTTLFTNNIPKNLKQY